MAFVMISTGTVSRSGVRTLSGRALALGGLGAALILLGLGAALGYGLAPVNAGPSPAGAANTAEAAPPSVLPFTIEQLGALSGRLFKLESQASELGKRLGLPAGAAKPPAAAAAQEPSAPRAPRSGPPPAPETGSGGPLLPPRADLPAPEALAPMQERLAAVEEQLAALGKQAALGQLRQMAFPSQWPIVGAAIGSPFGNRVDPITRRSAFHGGLDFAAEYGSRILASAGGRVSFAGFRPDFGWTVEIEHGNGLLTRYAHASKLLVKRGALVGPHEAIALVGSSGRSTGPHLHYEVLRNGAHTDPRTYLAQR